MVELELRIPIDGTPPLAVLATAKLAGFSLSVRPLFIRSPVLVLANGRRLFGINTILWYLARRGTGIPNLYDRDDSETNQIYQWLEHVHTLFSDSEYKVNLITYAQMLSYIGDGQRSESLMKSREYQNLVRWYKMISTDHADLLKELTATSSQKED